MIPKMTWNDAKALTFNMDSLAVDRFFKLFLRKKWEPNVDIGLTELLQLLVYDWLEQFDFIIGSQQEQIVRRAVQAFDVLNDVAIDGGEYPIVMLSILDYRYVVCTGLQKLYDMESDEEVDELKRLAITSFSFNVTAALLLATERFESRKAGFHGRTGKKGVEGAS